MRLTTSLDYQKQIRNNEIPVETGEHAHPPDPAGVQVKKIENRVTQLASSTTQGPRQVVQSVIQKVSQEAAQRVRSATNLRETVRRKRRADGIVNKRLVPVIHNRQSFGTLGYLSAIAGNLEININ